MRPGLVLFGGVLGALGAVGVVRAKSVARINEQVDAVGSTTALDTVEPAGWKVQLTRATAAVFVVVGLGLLVSGLTA